MLVAVIGLVTWALVTYVPMPSPVRSAIIICAVVIIVLMLLTYTGLLSTFNAPMPRVR